MLLHEKKGASWRRSDVCRSKWILHEQRTPVGQVPKAPIWLRSVGRPREKWKNRILNQNRKWLIIGCVEEEK